MNDAVQNGMLGPHASCQRGDLLVALDVTHINLSTGQERFQTVAPLRGVDAVEHRRPLLLQQARDVVGYAAFVRNAEDKKDLAG